jgi:hypothetical protein
MTDPNETRYHYRKTAEKLARKRQTRTALAWLAVWLFAAAAVLLSII